MTSTHRIRRQLRGLRVAASLTQAALAARLGKSAKWVTMIEGGSRGIKPEEIFRWAEVCGFDAQLAFEPRSHEPPSELRDTLLALLAQLPQGTAADALAAHIAAWEMVARPAPR